MQCFLREGHWEMITTCTEKVFERSRVHLITLPSSPVGLSIWLLGRTHSFVRTANPLFIRCKVNLLGSDVIAVAR